MSTKWQKRVVMLAGTLVVFGALASVGRGVPQIAPLAPAPTLTAEMVCRDQVATIETELATLLQRRVDAAGTELAIIDYQIDLRLLQRWMLSAATEAKAGDELQAVVILRSATLQSAAQRVAERMQNSGKALLPSQLDGLSKLHELTYKLPPIKSIGVLDDACQTMASDLILAANPPPEEVNHLPPMRPKWSPGSSPTAPPVRRSPAELIKHASEMQISAGLKRQLVALGTAAQSAGIDPKNQEEATALRDALSDVVAVADGLEQNVGIDIAARPKVEQQLAEGLALFTDTRTRASGTMRIAALSQYRKTLIRIQRLNLPMAIQQKISPALVYVNNNPESAGVVLGAIEKYLKTCARADAATEPAGLTPAQHRTIEGLQKQLTLQRSAFLDEAANLGARGGFVQPNPSALADRVSGMAQLLDSIDSIRKLPQAVAALALLRPKPAGALERREAIAFADLNSSIPTPTHDASMRFIADAERLADLADVAVPPGIAPATIKAYTHDRLASVQTRKAAILSELASQLAVGKDMDAADLAKLQLLHDLMNSLPLANDAQACLTKAEALTRWADWAISPAQIGALLQPYRDATASAFEGFADDNATPLFRWPEQNKRYVPILLLAREGAAHADECAAMPTGLSGDLARLLTPMEDQPYSMERSASLEVMLWQASAGMNDPRLTDAMFDAMLARLAKEFGGKQ